MAAMLSPAPERSGRTSTAPPEDGSRLMGPGPEGASRFLALEDLLICSILGLLSALARGTRSPQAGRFLQDAEPRGAYAVDGQEIGPVAEHPPGLPLAEDSISKFWTEAGKSGQKSPVHGIEVRQSTAYGYSCIAGGLLGAGGLPGQERPELFQRPRTDAAHLEEVAGPPEGTAGLAMLDDCDRGHGPDPRQAVPPRPTRGDTG